MRTRETNGSFYISMIFCWMVVVCVDSPYTEDIPSINANFRDSIALFSFQNTKESSFSNIPTKEQKRNFHSNFHLFRDFFTLWTSQIIVKVFCVSSVQWSNHMSPPHSQDDIWTSSDLSIPVKVIHSRRHKPRISIARKRIERYVNAKTQYHRKTDFTVISQYFTYTYRQNERLWFGWMHRETQKENSSWRIRADLLDR